MDNKTSKQGVLSKDSTHQTYIFKMSEAQGMLTEMRDYYVMHGEFELPELSLAYEDDGVCLMTENIIPESKRYTIYAEGLNPDTDINPIDYANFLCGCELDMELSLDYLLRQIFLQGGKVTSRLVLQFDKRPVGVTRLRESLQVLREDTQLFVDALRDPRKIQGGEKMMETFEEWEDVFRFIPREDAEIILDEYISELPEDEQWICRNALNKFDGSEPSWDEAYGLPGLEDEVKRQFALNPSDSLATLKQIFATMRQKKA